MISKDYVIYSAAGIHARPATALIKLAKTYQSVISLKKGDKTVRLNSMLNILAMATQAGDTLTVLVEGPDETEAAAAIDTFFTEQLKNL
ncbi:phosphocarrier protein [Chitinophaga costaii]|uniref:Phosphocarrier protein HPr n=1 Tax=Chitinophaga costaii TaxID=1335309 RepID=A0A1C4CL66_9BACT|nr:HPr family phosphocarrier protein [Chitinophaga costaii]PUZ27045.1 HPr family phosphocarrier protein [Chitinophaga costaii]SCC19829.1 phosphocarrier protein [Chitinophaga costaii]